MNEITVSQKAGTISCNFEEMDAEIDGYIKDYSDLVFTEDGKKDAKDTVAFLRKRQKEIDNVIKEVTKAWDAPLIEWKVQMNERKSRYDVPIIRINDQIDAFEERRKEEKAARIQEIYDELIPEEEIRSYIPLARIKIEKWLNATYSENQIKDDIMLQKMNVKSGIESIKILRSDVEEKALAVFKKTLQVTDAVRVIGDYEESKELFKHKVETETRAEVVDSFIPVEGGKEKCYLYNIFLTEDGKAKLEAFMDSVGIEYHAQVDEGGFDV